MAEGSKSRGDAVPQISLRPLPHQNCIRRDRIVAVAPTNGDSGQSLGLVSSFKRSQRFASSCDNGRPIIDFGTCRLQSSTRSGADAHHRARTTRRQLGPPAGARDPDPSLHRPAAPGNRAQRAGPFRLRQTVFISRCHDERFSRGKKLEHTIFWFVRHNLLLNRVVFGSDTGTMKFVPATARSK